jgi:hypothetical protein
MALVVGGVVVVFLATAAGVGLQFRHADPHRADRIRVEHALSRGAADVGSVLQDIRAIEDPILRTSAVMEWLSRHGDRISAQASFDLCDTLPEPARGSCLRRSHSPHLRAPR